MHFYLDNRDHGTDSLVEPELAKFQGPALLAYNNDAMFTNDDWESIQRSPTECQNLMTHSKLENLALGSTLSTI